MSYLEFDQGQLYYDIQGQGPPIVLIRGLSRSSAYWLGFDKELSKYFQVITLDNRGVGFSSAKVPWNLSISDMAYDIVTLLDHLDIQKTHVMGVSLGGMVALSFGKNYPDRCLSLTIVNSSISGQGTMRLSPKATIRMLIAGLSPKRINDQLEHLLVSKAYPDDQRKEMRSKWKGIEDQEGFPFVTTIKQLVAALKFNEREIEGLSNVPTTVVYGSEDMFVPPVNSLAIHRLLPKSKLIRLDEAGHEAMTDKPELLIEILRKQAKSSVGKVKAKSKEKT